MFYRGKKSFIITLFLLLTALAPGALSAADYASAAPLGGVEEHGDRDAAFSNMGSLKGHCLSSFDSQRTNECSVSSHSRRLNSKTVLKGLFGETGNCRLGHRSAAIYLLLQEGNSREKLPQGARSPPFSDLLGKLFLMET